MPRHSSLASIDFVRRIPHRFWYSAWFADEEHPDGCRYKLISSRGTASATGPLELVVLVENADGTTLEANRVEVSEATFEKTASMYVDGLSENGKLVFFAVDLIKCRTLEAMERILGDSAWHRGPGT
jgi:hypothetical protein